MRTPGPKPLIFLCQAGSKAEQKWRFGDGSVTLNPEHQGLQNWWRRQTNLGKTRGGKEELRDCCRGIARGAGFLLPETEHPIHLTYMKEQQLSPHTILKYVY